jgi:hypothetical protein
VFADGSTDDLNVHPADREPRNAYGFEWMRVKFPTAALSYTRIAVPYWVLLFVAQTGLIVLIVRAATQ